MGQGKFLARGVHRGACGLFLRNEDGGVVLAHHPGVGQVLQWAFQHAGLGGAEKAAREVGGGLLFQGAVRMVEKVGVGILGFALGDGVGTPCKDAQIAQILDIGGFVEKGDGQADDVFAAGEHFSGRVRDGVERVGLGNEKLARGVTAFQGDGVRRALDFLVHRVVIGRVLRGVHVEDEFANAPVLRLVDGDVVVRNLLCVYNVVVKSDATDGAADAVESVSDEGLLLAIHLFCSHEGDRIVLVFLQGLIDGKLSWSSGFGGC